MWFRKRIRRIGKVEAQTIFYIIHQNQMRQKNERGEKTMKSRYESRHTLGMCIQQWWIILI